MSVLFVHARGCRADSAPCVTSRGARVSCASLQAHTRGEADSWDALFSREPCYRSALLRHAWEGVGSAPGKKQTVSLPATSRFSASGEPLANITSTDFIARFHRKHFLVGDERCKFTFNINNALVECRIFTDAFCMSLIDTSFVSINLISCGAGSDGQPNVRAACVLKAGCILTIERW